MIKYNKVYRGTFRNQEVDHVTNLSEDVDIIVDIYDTTSGTDNPDSEIIPLPMADNPCIIESVDNDELKTAIIRSTRATVNIFSSDSIGIETFVDGGDSRFFGYVYSSAFDFLLGPVSVADVAEDLQPDPNIISLVISDGLGFADEEELTDENGDPLQGVHNIWYYIRLALLKTGQSMEALVSFNIREKFAPTLNSGDSAAGHIFQYCYLDAKTFEGTNTGTMLSAAEVLKRILFGCYLCQSNGKWLILSLDEIQGDADLNLFNVDEDGVFVNGGQTANLNEIGFDLDLSFMNDDAIVTADRSIKRYDLKFLYEFPAEIPCNIDFEHGVGADPTGAASETIDYDLECWDFLREGTDPEDLDQAPFAGSTGVLRKLFEFNYEKDRYLVNGTAGGFRHYFKSSGIKMAEKSKIAIGFQWRSASDTAGVTVNIAHMRLVGDDGNVYDWELTTGGVSSWVQKVVTDTVFDTTWQQTISGIDDSKQQSISATSQPVPVSGTLYIRLLNDLSTPQRYFSALTVSYTPMVNGSYAKYTGHRYRIDQDTDAKGKMDDQLFIDTAPDRNIKGALLKRGDDLEIFSGSASFGGVGQIEITGDVRPAFQPYIGEIIIIEGTTLNDQECSIVSINYSIIGNVTTIFTTGTFTTELGVTCTISLATYELAELFYSGAVLPDGPTSDDQSKPYGLNISFNVWNQYNRVMRKVDGNIDGLQTDTLGPSFFNKFSLTDVNINMGTRVFMLLHFAQNLHLCEWSALLVEVHDPAVGKVYTGNSFKYLTEGER